MSEVQTVSAVIHEIAHSKLHNYEKAAEREGKEPEKEKDRHTEEVEAESISYAVCQYYGIETGGNSFGYIASWSQGKELPELRASLEVINKTAGNLIQDIDRNFRAICQERGIDFSKEANAGERENEGAEPELEEPRSASSRRPRRYAMDENGEIRRTWNGKFPEEFGGQDIHGFMKETEQVLQGMDETGKGKPEPVTSKDLEQQVKNGQSISLMELVGAIRREERKKKPSVIQKLKEWTGHERNKTAPKRDKEREI